MRQILITLAASAALTAAASAQTLPSPAVMQELQAKCGGDYAKFCSGVTPGGGRIIACMQQHAAQLSPVCKSTLIAQQR